MRPVLVIQSDLLNDTGHPSTWVLPCTTRLAGENLLRAPLPRGAAGNPQDCEVMLDQSRAIDNRRLERLLGMLPPALLREVTQGAPARAARRASTRAVQHRRARGHGA